MKKKFDLFFPWLVVLIATVGALFFTELTKREPCTLCWYQRMIMFPLAIILGIAAFRNAYRIIVYVLPLALIGLGISTYHLVMVKFFSGENLCPACIVSQATDGLISFPLVSFLAFFALNGLLIWAYFRHRGSKKL